MDISDPRAVREFVERAVYNVWHAYPALTRREIAWHSWSWLQRRMREVRDREREKRRWLLRAMSVAAAVPHSEDASMVLQDMFDETLTPEELEAARAAEDRERLRRAEEQRAERIAAVKTELEAAIASGQKTEGQPLILGRKSF